MSGGGAVKTLRVRKVWDWHTVGWSVRIGWLDLRVGWAMGDLPTIAWIGRSIYPRWQGQQVTVRVWRFMVGIAWYSGASRGPDSEGRR